MGEDFGIHTSTQWNADVAGAADARIAEGVGLTSTSRGGVFTDSQSVDIQRRVVDYEAYAHAPRPQKPHSSAPKAELYHDKPVDSAPSSAAQAQLEVAQNKSYVALVKELIKGNQELSEQEKSAALFSFFVPDYPSDPKVAQALAKAIENANAQMLQKDPRWVQPTMDPKVFNIAYGHAVEGAFENARAKRAQEGKPPLTKEQLADMEYALYHPDKASPHAKALLNDYGIREGIKSILGAAGFALPTGWPPDAALFDRELNAKGDVNFEMAVDVYVKQHHLSTADGYRLKSAYYGANVSLSPEQAQALEELRKAAGKGMPEGWEPVPNAKLWNGLISANFRDLNDQLLSQYMAAHPELTPADALLIRQAMNGAREGIPNDIVRAAEQIKSQALQQIQQKYGVSSNWIVSGNAISETPSTTPQQAILRTLSDAQIIMENYAKNLKGPAGVVAMDFLKAVSEALSGLRELIYRMEAGEAEGQIGLSKAQQELQQFKIDQHSEALRKQAEEQKKVDDKQEKLGVFKLVMQIVTPIMAVISIAATIVSLGTLGPAAVGLIVLMTTCSCIDMIPGVDGKMAEWTMNLIGTALREISIACGADPTKAKWADFAGKLLTVVLVVLATKGAGAQSALMTSTQYFSSSNLITDALVAEDVDPMVTAIVAGSVNAGVSLGAMGVGMAMKGAGTTTATALAETADRLSRSAAAATNSIQRAMYNAAAAFYRTAARFVDSTMKANLVWVNRVIMMTQLTNSGLQSGGSALEYQINQARGELAVIKKLFEAKDMSLRDLIEALKQQVKKLQEILDNLIAWLPSVGESSAELWDKNRTPQAPI